MKKFNFTIDNNPIINKIIWISVITFFVFVQLLCCAPARAEKFQTRLNIDASKIIQLAQNVKKEHNDVALDASIPVKVVEDKTINSKGKEVTKYYCVIKGELYSTSKSVVEYIYLCERLSVTPRLAIRDNKKIVKL